MTEDLFKLLADWSCFPLGLSFNLTYSDHLYTLCALRCVRIVRWLCSVLLLLLLLLLFHNIV
jgi:hypothetical protein